jgi:hypothetical protein
MILSEYEQKVVRRQALAILQSPQGRDFGRHLLAEKGKVEGDFGKLKNELLDIMSECINDLYQADAPKLNR